MESVASSELTWFGSAVPLAVIIRGWDQEPQAFSASRCPCSELYLGALSFNNSREYFRNKPLGQWPAAWRKCERSVH